MRSIICFGSRVRLARIDETVAPPNLFRPTLSLEPLLRFQYGLLDDDVTVETRHASRIPEIAACLTNYFVFMFSETNAIK